MTIRCKARVTQVTQFDDSGARTIKLGVATGDSPENKAFFKRTPSFEIDLAIVNPETAKVLEIGKEFYVDFIPAG